MTLRDVHEAWAWVTVVANGLAGSWALAAHWLLTLRRRSLWWFTIAAELAISVQVSLGAALIAVEGRTAPPMHVFYGFVALMAVAIIYSYRQQVPQRYLLYGGGGLFLMGLGLRAIFLA